MKHIIYSSPFVPAEWIKAHGLEPLRLMPSDGRDVMLPGAGNGICPFVRSFIGEVCAYEDTAAAVIMTTTCDQMRRGVESLEHITDLPIFLMNVPATWQTQTARDIYRSELERLSIFLSSLGGSCPTIKHLSEVMKDYEQQRLSLLAERKNLKSRDYSKSIADFYHSGILPDHKHINTPDNMVRLALVGGPLIQKLFSFFDVVEQNGGRIVLDATETGERTLPVLFDTKSINDDPFAALVDAYFGNIPDAFRRPNTMLYSWFGQKIAERSIDGILLHRYLWCDTWHAEIERIKEWSPVPMLALDSIEDGSFEMRSVMRIQSFIEILRNNHGTKT